MGVSQQKKLYPYTHTGLCKSSYQDTVFEKSNPTYKKVPGVDQVRMSPVGQPRNFHGCMSRYKRLHTMNPSRANIKPTL